MTDGVGPISFLRTLWSGRREDILALGGIVLFFLVFFSWTLFTGKHLVTGDAFFYTYPLRTISWQMLRSGNLPLWTPYLFSGYPLLSMAQLSLGYPLTWGHLFLPSYRAEEVYILAPFLLSPTFTYFYLRKVQRSPLASLLGALTFGYGGMMSGPIANSGLIPNGIMWLPLMLIVIEWARRHALAPCLIAGTAVYSMSVLNGHAQSFLTVGLLAAAYSLWLVFFITRVDERQRSIRLTFIERWRPFLVAIGSGVLALGVGAFQILESARVVGFSVRSALTYDVFTQGSFALIDLWRSFVTPLFYVIDMHAYVPPLAAGLACFSMIVYIRSRASERDTRVLFWAIVAVLSWVLMLGQYSRIYLILYYVPILNLFRVPSRHTIEWTFAAGVLAAYGWDALVPVAAKWRGRTNDSSITTTVASLVLLLMGLLVGYVWWVKAQTLVQDATGRFYSSTIYQLWKASFVLLLFGALWRAGLIDKQRTRGLILGAIIVGTCFVEPSLLTNRWWKDLARPAQSFSTPSPTTRFLQQFSPTENRVYTRVSLMSEQAAVTPRFDGPNLPALWGQHEVAGYEPLMLKRYSQALGGAWLDGVHPINGGPADDSLLTSRSHVLDLLNTTYLISYANLATSLPEVRTSTTKPSEFWTPVFENNEAVVLRNSRAMPRAWLVADAQAVDSQTALQTIRGETTSTFDPRRTALLEVSQADLPSLPRGPVATDSLATVTSYQPNHLTIDTNSSTDTVLVVSEIFYPGWEVTVDGNPGRVLIADYILRGVPLTAGRHRVEMYYAPRTVVFGAIISALTLALLGGVAIYSRKWWFDLAESRPRDVTSQSPARGKSVVASFVRFGMSLPAWSRDVLIFVAFIALTALMTWPWVLHLRNAVSDTGDPYMIAWTLWWDYHQTFHDPLRLFHANIFYPFHYTLAFSEHDYGIAMFFFPLFALGVRPLTIHSIATFVGFAFCGYGAFRLARTLTGSTFAGWVAGIVFAFIPFRFQLLSHLHYLFAGWIPLTLEALVLFMRERTWKRAAWLGIAFFMNALTCISWMIYAFVPLGISAVVLIVRHQLKDRSLLRGLVGVVLALVLLTPFLWPYYRAGKLYDLKWPPSEAEKFSASVSDWFSAEPRNQLWNGFGEGLPNISNHLFPGLLALLLPLAAIFIVGTISDDERRPRSQPLDSTKRARWLRVLDITILLAFITTILAMGFHKGNIRFFRGGTADRAMLVLSIAIILRLAIAYPRLLKRGPNENLVEWLRSPERSDGFWIGAVWAITGFLTAAGTAIFFNRLLNDLFLPYRSLRIPGRAAMICYVGLAVLSGVGALKLTSLLASRAKPIKPWLSCAVIIFALVYELNAVPLVLVSGAADPDAVTLTLKNTPMRGGLVELPTNGPDFPLHYAMLRAADHGKPLVNGASTFVSPFSRRIDELTNGSTIVTNEFLDFLEQVPTSYVVVRHRMIPSDRKKVFDDFLSEARNSERLRLAGHYENGDELYVVTKTEPEAH